MTTEIYQVEKWVWTEADFEAMGWHDSRIHALAFLPETFEFVLDIDYILKWVDPQVDEVGYKFWVSPATLVFKNVYDIAFDLAADDLTIMDIKRGDESVPRNAQYVSKNAEWLWTIECLNGEINFRSAGYKQYIRSSPLLGGQVLAIEVRGLSFERAKID